MAGIILSKNLCMPDINREGNENVLIIGGSGARKSYNYIGPNIMQANGSYVILDPAGGLYEQYAPFLRYKGYDIRHLNLIDPEKSNKYNPFNT